MNKHYVCAQVCFYFRKISTSFFEMKNCRSFEMTVHIKLEKMEKLINDVFQNEINI